MPSWKTHLYIANKISEELEIKEKEEYIFANIMPDILEGYVVRNVSQIVKKYETHFPKIEDCGGISIPIPDIKRFKEKYWAYKNNPIVLGYFSHLLTDYFWNQYTYQRYFKQYDKEKDLIEVTLKNQTKQIVSFKEGVAIKQKDFKKLANELGENLNYQIPFDISKILKDSQTIEESPYTIQDIIKTVQFIKNLEKEKYKKIPAYEMFQKEEIYLKLKECIQFVKENIEN